MTSSSQTTTTVAFCSLAVHWIALCLYQIKIDWPGKLGRTLQPQSIHEGPGLTLDQPSRERTWSIPEDRDHFLDTGPQSSSLHHRPHFCQEEWKHLLQRTSKRPRSMDVWNPWCVRICSSHIPVQHGLHGDEVQPGLLVDADPNPRLLVDADLTTNTKIKLSGTQVGILPSPSYTHAAAIPCSCQNIAQVLPKTQSVSEGAFVATSWRNRTRAIRSRNFQFI